MVECFDRRRDPQRAVLTTRRLGSRDVICKNSVWVKVCLISRDGPASWPSGKAQISAQKIVCSSRIEIALPQLSGPGG
jgi:hypothetical protein